MVFEQNLARIVGNKKVLETLWDGDGGVENEGKMGGDGRRSDFLVVDGFRLGKYHNVGGYMYRYVERKHINIVSLRKYSFIEIGKLCRYGLVKNRSFCQVLILDSLQLQPVNPI